jgi:glycine cleavage system aminomethyltransferase T
MTHALSFLEVSPQAANAVSAMSIRAARDGARFETSDGWRIAMDFGDTEAERRACRETIGFADVSHLTKFGLYGPVRDPLGSAAWRQGAWWCPITEDRQLVVCPPAGSADVRASLTGQSLDLTAAYGAAVVAGPLARETFARFCALDLRDRQLPVHGFRPGSVARTPGFVLREAAERYLVLFGAAYGAYFWDVLSDAATRLGGRPVGARALPAVQAGDPSDA